MRNASKHFLSIACLALFAYFAIASAGAKVYVRPFGVGKKVEDPAETRNFLVMNDGSKVYGDKIKIKSPLFKKEYLMIDDQKFQVKEVQGYGEYGVYYKRFGGEYIERIVHGTINIYYRDVQMQSTSTDNQGHTYTHYYTVRYYYYQNGEDDLLKLLKNQNMIKTLVSDCPAAEALADKSNGQLRKAIRHDHFYMNEIFDTYNNGCGSAGRKDSAVAVGK